MWQFYAFAALNFNNGAIFGNEPEIRTTMSILGKRGHWILHRSLSGMKNQKRI